MRYRILLLAALLTFPVWLAGCGTPNLDNAKTAREWIRRCATIKEDLYCKAAHEALKDVQGPIVFLIPDGNIQETSQALVKKYGADAPQAIQRLVRANLFQAIEITSGTMVSLDGQKRQATCRTPSQGCRIEDLLVGKFNHNRLPREYGGMIYTTVNPQHGSNLLEPQ